MKRNVIFNPKELRAAVARKAALSPFVLYPAVVGGLGALSCGLLGVSLTTLSAFAGGSLVALAAWVVEARARHETNALKIVKESVARIEAERAILVANLEQELKEFSLPVASDQLRNFQNAFGRFCDVLDDRFSPTELTYSRYLAVAERVYLSGLDNIRNAIILKKSTCDTDENEVRARLSDKPEDLSEAMALQQRLDGYENAQREIGKILVVNERALTKLAEVTQTLAVTRIGSGTSDSDTESAMAELDELSERLSEYI